MNALFFWLILLFVFWVAWTLGARSAAARQAARAEPEPSVPMDTLADWESRLAPMMAITGRKAAGGVAEFEGRLRGASSEMFRRIRQAFMGESVTPMLLEGEGSRVQVLMLPAAPREGSPDRPKWWLHSLLFVATLLLFGKGALRSRVTPSLWSIRQNMVVGFGRIVKRRPEMLR